MPLTISGALMPVASSRVGTMSLERVPFLEQLVDTLRIRTGDAGQSLQISRLPARTGFPALRWECHCIHALAFFRNLFLERAHRLRADCLVADGLRFYRRLFRGWLLPRRFLLRDTPLLIQLLRRPDLLAGSSLRLRLLLLGFLFGSHTRSLPPAQVRGTKPRWLYRAAARRYGQETHLRFQGRGVTPPKAHAASRS